MKPPPPLAFDSLQELRRQMNEDSYLAVKIALRWAADEIRRRMFNHNRWRMGRRRARRLAIRMYFRGEIAFIGASSLVLGVWDSRLGCWRGDSPDQIQYPMESPSLGPFL